MDQLAATIGAACAEAMRGVQNELNDLKTSHHAAIDLFSSKFGELRRQLSEQDKHIKSLQNENAGLKEAQQDQQQSCLKPSDINALRKELDQLKHTSYATKSSLQNQFGTLQATQSQQLGRIEELAKKTAAVEQLRDNDSPQTKSRTREYKDLNARVTDQVQQLESLQAENWSLIQANEDRNAAIKRLETAVTACASKLADSDYDDALTDVRNSLSHLQKVQKGHGRTMETFATEQDRLRQAIQQQEAHIATIRNDFQGVIGEHERKLNAYTGDRAGPTGARQAQAALTKHHDAALSSLEESIADVSKRLAKTEMRTDELREELLTVTRTMLKVIKQMRGREKDNEEPEERRRAGTACDSATSTDALTISLPQLSAPEPAAEPKGPDRAMQDVFEGMFDREEYEEDGADNDVCMSVEVAPSHGDFPSPSPQPQAPAAETFAIDDDAERVVSNTQTLIPPSAQPPCHHCRRTESASWHRGPDGPKTLCNTCSRKYSKSVREQQSAVSLPAQNGATAASIISAPVRDTSASVRDTSASSTSTVGTYDQKERRLEELQERALKRKRALSSLKTTDTIEETNIASRMPDHSNAYDLGGMHASDEPSLVAGPSAEPDNAQTFANSATAEPAQAGRAPSKPRKRMTADEKAKLSASEFTAITTPEVSRKRRKRIANKSKTVRFHFDEDFDDLEDEQGDNLNGSVSQSGDIFGLVSDKKHDPSTSVATRHEHHNPPSQSEEMISTAQPTGSMGQTYLKLSDLKERRNTPKKKKSSDTGKPSASPAAMDTTKGKTQTKNKRNTLPTSVAAEDATSSDDNITVARRRKAVSKTPEPATTLSVNIASDATSMKDTDAANNVPSSPDELSLPPRFRFPSSRPANAASSLQSDSVLESTEGDTYRSLLSQFNLDKGGQKSMHDPFVDLEDDDDSRPNRQQKQLRLDEGVQKNLLRTVAARDEENARPKRQPKPRDFGDVVDLRTLKVKQLGR